MSRLTKQNDFGNLTSLKYVPEEPIFLDYTKTNTNIVEKLLNKVGQLEDIEDVLKKTTFYGKVLQYPNEIFELKFREISKGNEFPLDIRIAFDIKNMGGSVCYSIFDYCKVYSFNKEDLL